LTVPTVRQILPSRAWMTIWMFARGRKRSLPATCSRCPARGERGVAYAVRDAVTSVRSAALVAAGVGSPLKAVYANVIVREGPLGTR
jgi:hypothetical protein